MQIGKYTALITLATAALLLALKVPADDTARIGVLSDMDKQYMAQQRAALGDMAGEKLGRHFNGTKDNDLQILQLLLDKRLVRPGQTQQLQAMGMVMGDLLAADLDMHWVIYEDAHGRSRALRYGETANYLFPVTMISRREEADNHTPVTAIYQKAYDIIAPLRPKLPYQ